MRVFPTIFVASLMFVFAGCDKFGCDSTEKAAAPAQPAEETLLDREYDIPQVKKVGDMYTVTEHGGQLIGEVSVNKGNTVDVYVKVDNKKMFEDNGVHRTTIDVTLPPGSLMINISRHGDDTDPLTVNEKFKMRSNR